MKRLGGRRAAWIAQHQDDVLADLGAYFASMGEEAARADRAALEEIELLEDLERRAAVSSRRVVVTRGEHRCARCRAEVPAGTRVLSVSAGWSGGRGRSWWWCPACEPAGGEKCPTQ